MRRAGPGRAGDDRRALVESGVVVGVEPELPGAAVALLPAGDDGRGVVGAGDGFPAGGADDDDGEVVPARLGREVALEPGGVDEVGEVGFGEPVRRGDGGQVARAVPPRPGTGPGPVGRAGHEALLARNPGRDHMLRRNAAGSVQVAKWLIQSFRPSAWAAASSAPVTIRKVPASWSRSMLPGVTGSASTGAGRPVLA